MYTIELIFLLHYYAIKNIGHRARLRENEHLFRC